MFEKTRPIEGVVRISDDIRETLRKRKTDETIYGKFIIPNLLKECPYSCKTINVEYLNEPKVFAICKLGVLGRSYREKHGDEYVPLLKEFQDDAGFFASQHKKYKITRMRLRTRSPRGWLIEKIEFISDASPDKEKNEDFKNIIKEEVEEAIDFYGTNYGFALDFWTF